MATRRRNTTAAAPPPTSTSETAGGPGARRPRQPRGEARVDQILAAAARLIAQSGTAAVSIHAVAREARTSIGSMYHFFADRECLLLALAERHRGHLRRINEEIAQTPAATWRQWSAHAAVAALVTPFIDHLRRHPDFLPLMHGRMHSQDDADFIRGIRRMLQARLPHASAPQHDRYAAVIHAMTAGGMHVGYERDPGQQDLYLEEIPRAIAAYLALIEAEAGAGAESIGANGSVAPLGAAAAAAAPRP